MDRIVTSRPGTLEVTFYDADGAELDTDAGEPVTLDLDGVRSGSILAGVAATAVGAEPTATWQYQLDGTEVADPDLLTATWTATVGGATVTMPVDLEAVGGEYTTVAAVLAKVPSASPGDVDDVIDEVADRIETATVWTWVPRLVTLVVQTDHHGTAVLPGRNRPLRQLIAVTDDDGDAVTTDRWRWTRTGVLHTGRALQRLTIQAEVGEDRLPTSLARAARRAAVDLTRDGAVNDRRNRADLDGNAYPFQTASLKHGRPFGIDGVDVVVMSHRQAVLA